MSTATCRTCGASGPPWKHQPSPFDADGIGDPGHRMTPTQPPATPHADKQEDIKTLLWRHFEKYVDLYNESEAKKFEKHVADFERDFESYIADRLATEAKAYGGCTNCYGKGYATVVEYASGIDTDQDIGSPGGKVFMKQSPIRYCSCDRGKQLKGHFATAEREARIDEVKILNDYLTRYDANASFITDYVSERLSALQPKEPQE